MVDSSCLAYSRFRARMLAGACLSMAITIGLAHRSARVQPHPPSNEALEKVVRSHEEAGEERVALRFSVAVCCFFKLDVDRWTANPMRRVARRDFVVGA